MLSIRSRLAATLLAVALASSLETAVGWTVGRATFYDDNTEGACRYGTSIPKYYAAWPDGQAGAPACGECYEVKCVNRNFEDGYGADLKRNNACIDEDETVIVKVVDSCPCVHANYYSNQRWCCGDAQHIDLGRAAFKRLAREHHGVVGVAWRQVSCPDGYETYSADDSKQYYKDEEGGKPTRSSSRRRSSSSSSSSSRSRSSWFGK